MNSRAYRIRPAVVPLRGVSFRFVEREACRHRHIVRFRSLLHTVSTTQESPTGFVAPACICPFRILKRMLPFADASLCGYFPLPQSIGKDDRRSGYRVPAFPGAWVHFGKRGAGQLHELLLQSLYRVGGRRLLVKYPIDGVSYRHVYVELFVYLVDTCRRVVALRYHRHL